MTFADTRIEKGQAEYTQADKKLVRLLSAAGGLADQCHLWNQ
jgi:hypothetical protein